MRGITIIFSFLFLCFSVLNGAELDPGKVQLIDGLINDFFIPLNNVSGLGLSIVLDGETVLSKGYGKRDVENDLDATNQTLFAIGSITKSFISTLVVKTLSERYPTYGELILDEPISSLLPEFNLTFSDRFRSEQMSFRDILSHRTCLLDQGFEIAFGTIKTNVEYTYRSRYQTEAPNCGFRSGFTYNNAYLALTGELIASMEGIPLQAMIRNFQKEIGMETATTLDVSGEYLENPNMSQCYYQLNGQRHKFNQGLLKRLAVGVGAGGILATPSDVAKYMSLHLNKGKVGDSQVVSEEALSWMYKVSNPIPDFLSGKLNDEGEVSGMLGLGLGLILSLYRGYSLIHHGGYWIPFKSEMYLFPAKHFGVFLTTNGPGELPDPLITHGLVIATIFDIVFGESSPDSSLETIMKNIIPVPSLETEGSRSSMINRLQPFEPSTSTNGGMVEFEDALGHYGHRIIGDLHITLDSEDLEFLQLNLGEWGIGRLVPTGSDSVYSVIWKTDFMDHYYADLAVRPAPVYYFEILPGEVHLLVDQIKEVFVRNATLDTFPVIPWDPNSCAPELSN